MRENARPPEVPDRLERQEGDISPEFFDLQLKFADAVQTKSGLLMESTLRDYTNLRQRFFGAANPRAREEAETIWQKYVEGLNTHKNRLDWTYQSYLRLRRQGELSQWDNMFGCFTFHLREDGGIQVHFENKDAKGGGPLSAGNIDKRLADLKAMFTLIKEQCPNAKYVHGESWLYNLDAYKRLFPESYTRNPEPQRGNFTHGRRWGQFLDSDGDLKKDGADTLLKNMEKEEITLGNLADAFPLQPLVVRGDIQDFYRMYGV